MFLKGGVQIWLFCFFLLISPTFCLIQKSRAQTKDPAGKPKTVELVVVVDNAEVWFLILFSLFENAAY